MTAIYEDNAVICKKKTVFVLIQELFLNLKILIFSKALSCFL